MTWQDEAAAYLTKHEGRISWLYLDVVGLVTVGVGYMIPTADAAAVLGFIWRDSGIAATSDEKASAWRTVKQQEPAHLANYYQNFTPLILPDIEIDRLLYAAINQFAASLGKRFPAFDTFPTNPKIGCTAMCYALGAAGLFHGYPRFCQAVDAQDWATAAQECHLGHVGEAENAALKQLFLAA